MEQVKLQELVEYFKKYNLTKTEILYLIHLYSVKQNKTSDEIVSIKVEDIFRQLTKLNEALTDASNTKYVAERLNREIAILRKVQQILESSDKSLLNEVLAELTLLSFESGVEIEPQSANEVLKNTISKGLK